MEEKGLKMEGARALLWVQRMDNVKENGPFNAPEAQKDVKIIDQTKSENTMA